jgi:integrase/recombinase XerD
VAQGQTTPAAIPGHSRLLYYPPSGQGPGCKRAGKPYDENDLALVLARIEALSAVPESDAVQVLLTYRAGLRPCEVAGLERRTLFAATGELKQYLEVMGATAKWGKPRQLYMHDQLKAALLRLFERYPHAERVAFKVLPSGELKYHSANYISHWFSGLYAGAGLVGCVGMSGRAAFATQLERYAPFQDVQRALGHAKPSTTALYLRPTGNLDEAIRKMGTEP